MLLNQSLAWVLHYLLGSLFRLAVSVLSSVQAPSPSCSLNSDKIVMDFPIRNIDGFLEALFSPVVPPGHEFVACVFSHPQIASVLLLVNHFLRQNRDFL